MCALFVSLRSIVVLVLPTPADAGQDPKFEQEHKSFSSSNVYLIICCNIAFKSVAEFRNLTIGGWWWKFTCGRDQNWDYVLRRHVAHRRDQHQVNLVSLSRSQQASTQHPAKQSEHQPHTPAPTHTTHTSHTHTHTHTHITHTPHAHTAHTTQASKYLLTS
jgi:hypothetical protein